LSRLAGIAKIRRWAATQARRSAAAALIAASAPTATHATPLSVSRLEVASVHIPDGYLSPETCGVMYVAAIPFWAAAASRVRRLLRGRTVPLLSIFAALSFAIMMFNVPVPGGTTAHGVGGTLVAIVLGPWAAIITTSVALVIQALFFGDGGVTAIGANCFNMAIVLPLVGYLSYRICAGNSPALSQRRVVAAAVGSYIGITVAALCVGVELGIQPHLWSSHGIPEYSPYGFSTAIPAMLAAHAFGASFVEAAITALGVAYLQKSYPDLVPGPRAGDAPREQRLAGWVVPAAIGIVAIGAIFVAGLIKGSGDLATWGGLNWSTVDWSGVGQMVIVSAIVSAIVLPLLVYLLRERPGLRNVALLFALLVIWVPIGLIAPGGAFGEDTSATQQEVSAALTAKAQGNPALFEALPSVNRECACVPTNINDVSYSHHAVLNGYEPPWVNAAVDPLWQQNLGYQVAALLGIGVLGAASYGLWQFGKWLIPTDAPDWRTA
jgi:cobalt/nickel transport system permease protein